MNSKVGIKINNLKTIDNIKTMFKKKITYDVDYAKYKKTILILIMYIILSIMITIGFISIINEFDLNKPRNVLYVYMIYTCVGLLFSSIGVYIYRRYIKFEN